MQLEVEAREWAANFRQGVLGQRAQTLIDTVHANLHHMVLVCKKPRRVRVAAIHQSAGLIPREASRFELSAS